MGEVHAADPKDLSIEELFAKLEEITSRMEEEGVSLEDSFELYKKGVSMVKACGDKIDKIEKQMILLTDDEQ